MVLPLVARPVTFAHTKLTLANPPLNQDDTFGLGTLPLAAHLPSAEIFAADQPTDAPSTRSIADLCKFR